MIIYNFSILEADNFSELLGIKENILRDGYMSIKN